MTANDLSPCLMNNPELKDILPTSYIPPNSTVFTKLLNAKYMQTKTIVSNKVQKCKYIGVQVDNYTATNKYPYCNASVSFVDENFNLKTIILETIKFHISHTAENVLKLMEGTGRMIEKAKLTHTMRTYTVSDKMVYAAVCPPPDLLCLFY